MAILRHSKIAITTKIYTEVVRARVSVTLDDVPGVAPDLLLRFRHFSTSPGRSRADVPPCAPVRG